MSTAAAPLQSRTAPPGTPAQRLVARVRAAWRRAVLLRAAFLAPALVVACAIGLIGIDLLAPLPASFRAGLRWVPLLAAGFALAGALLRTLRPPAPRRLALLAEERVPALENRLVTVLDAAASLSDGPVARAFAADAERRLADVEPSRVVRPRLRGPAALLAGGLVVGAVFAAAFPGAAAEARQRWLHPVDAYPSAWEEARATLPGVPAPPVPAFDEIRWRVVPPAYADLPPAEGRGDEPPSALVGSRLRLWSRFSTRWDEVRAVGIGGGTLPVRRERGEWVVEWTVPPGARGVAVEAVAGGTVVARRIVPLIALEDRPPDVRLVTPEADLVLAAGEGELPVGAAADDDYGVGELFLQWTHSRGSGESFEFLEGEWRFPHLVRHARSAAGTLRLDLASLGLQPGDVMHIRAVARDRNGVTGPGESVSRTRIVRVARPEELDEVNTVLGLPTELPKDPVLSQRMIILMTEALLARRGRLGREEFAHQSTHVGGEQGRLREIVGEQVFTRSTGAIQDPELHVGYLDEEGSRSAHAPGEAEHGARHGHEGARGAGSDFDRSVLEAASKATGQGTLDEVRHRHDDAPIIDVNRKRITIYNLMWASERALSQAMPDSALPYQHRALELIKELNRAERIYPTGVVRVDPVDVAAARGSGKLDGTAPAQRTAGRALPSVLPLLADLDHAITAAGTRPSRETSLRLSALAARTLEHPGADPESAALIARASAEASAGRMERARDLLRRARARLAPAGGAADPALPLASDPAAAEYFRRLGRPQP